MSKYKTVFRNRSLPSEWTFTRASDQTGVGLDGLLEIIGTNDLPAFVSSQGILLEGARTNLALHSADTSDVGWVASNMTKETNSHLDPFGNASTTIELTASDANATLLQTVTSAIDNYTYSVYLKRITGTGDIDITLDGGTTWATVAVTGSWLKFEATDASETNPVIGVRIVTDTDAILFLGSQLEKDANFSSSYIPTVADTVTRAETLLNADLTALGLSDPVNDISVHVVVRPQFVSDGDTGSTYILDLNDDSASDRYRYDANGSGDPRFQKFAPGILESITDTDNSHSANDLLNLRIRQSDAGMHMWSGNRAVALTNADAKADYDNALSNLDLGTDQSLGSNGFFIIDAIEIWDEAIADAELLAMSSTITEDTPTPLVALLGGVGGVVL